MRRPVLSRRLTLEEKLRVPDGAGGFVETWAALGTHWAGVVAGRGREIEAGGLTFSTVPYRIFVRAAPSGAPSRPVPGQRFRDGERVFNIAAVTVAGNRQQYLACIAREEVVT